MSETPGVTARSLLQEGKAAALAGDTFTARERFRRASEVEPDNAEAWLGLSSTVPILAEKRRYLERAIELEPANEEARASLEYVASLQSEGMQLAPAVRRAVQNESSNASPLLSAPEPVAVPEVLHCYRHPDRETGLRCVQCNRPICGECAYVTPVGQLCPECRRDRRPTNYQVSAGNVTVSAVVAAVLGALAMVLVVFVLARIPFMGLILTVMAGPAVGEGIVRASDRLTKLKRGRRMQIAVGAGIVVGALPLLLLLILSPSLITLIAGLFLFLAVSTAAARLR